MKARALPFLLSTLIFSASVQADEPVLDAKLRRLVEQIAAAPDAEKAARGYVELFRKPDQKLLAQLKQVKQTGVALRAAWEEVLLAGLILDKQTKDKRVKPEAAERFLGFVEGRLGIDLPSWWEHAVKTACLGGGKRIVPGTPTWIGKKKTEDGWDYALRTSQENLHRLKEMSVPIPQSLLDEEFRDGLFIKTCLTSQRCFMVFHDASGYSFTLGCVNRKTGATLWKNRVWDWACNFAQTGGFGCENVEILVRGKQVLVVGSGYMCFFIESFDSETGRNEFRFANWYAAEIP